MIIWLDAQISPSLASWLESSFAVVAKALRDIDLRDAADERIFRAARKAGAVIMTKDSDFIKLHYLYGVPPQIIWLTCGNTSNNNLRAILQNAMPKVLLLLQNGENLVEIGSV